jgi:2-keto-4-pentenoate hydratase
LHRLAYDISQRAAIKEAADRLLEAYATRRPTEPIRALIGDSNIGAAYDVQQRVIASRVQAGAVVVGRKIGITSEAVMRQVGVDQPDFGVLLDEMQYADGEVIRYDSLLQPRAEVEVAFVLGADIVSDCDRDALRAAVAYARPAIEIVDSRVRNWDITIADTVADNASSGAFVLGNARLTLDEFEPKNVTMSLVGDGEELSSGIGAACLGDPLNALAWLARTALHVDSPLRAGDIILSGALGPLAPINPGQTLTATLTSLGTVTATFSQGGTG